MLEQVGGRVRIRALVPAAVLAAALLLYYHPVVLGRTFLIAGQTTGALPGGPYGMERNSPRQVVDPGASGWMEEPWTALARELLRSGQMPLWNPYFGLGAPLLGHLGAAAFFPLKAWVYLLPFELGWDFYVFSRLFLAAFFTYAFARSLGVSRTASLFAGIAYGLSGPLVLDYNQNWIGAHTFAPAQFACLEQYAQSRRRRWLVFAAFATASGALAGNPAPSMLATAAASIYYLAAVAARSFPRRETLGREALRAVGALALLGLLSGLLSAVQSIPFVEATLAGSLGHESGVGFHHWHWHERGLAVLLPEVFSRDVMVAGLGILPLFLAALAAVAPPAGKRWRAWCLAALVLVGFGKLFGLPWLQWLGAVPVFDRIFFFRQLPPLLAFFVAILAAMGLDRLGDRRTPRLAPLAAGALIVGWFLAAAPPHVAGGFPWDRVTVIALLTFLVLGLLIAGARYRPRFVPLLSALPIGVFAVWSYAVLAPKTLPPRLFPYADPPFVQWIKSQAGGAERVLSLDGYLHPSISSAFGLPNLSMLDAIFPARVTQLAERLEPGFASRSADMFRIPTRATREHVPPIWQMPVLNLLGIRYLITGAEPLSGSFFDPLLRAGERAVAEKACFAAGTAEFVIDGVRKKGLGLHPPCAVRYGLAVPGDALALEFSVALDPAVWSADKGDGIRFRLVLEDESGETPLVDEYLDPKSVPADRRWSFHHVPIRGLRGRDVVIRLETDPGPRGDNGWDWGGWADLGLTAESDDDPSVGRWRREYEAEAQVYRNSNALPRAFVVDRSRQVDSGEEALSQILRRDFNPRQTVIFDPEGPSPTARPSPPAVDASPLPDPVIVLYEPARVRLSTATPRDGYLVLSDVYYPGWRATIDGEDTPIFQGDYLLRVVELPAGDHEVEFTYDPLGFKLGAALSLGTLGCCLLVLVRRKRGDGVARG